MKKNVINLNAGEIIIQDIKITNQSMVEDFYNLSKQLIKIKDKGNNNARIQFINYVESNGILAEINFSIDERFSFRRIKITPIIKPNTDNLSLLEASKLWFRGIAIGEYTETEDAIGGMYSWGHFSARYRDDRDYGIVGGEIIITFS